MGIDYRLRILDGCAIYHEILPELSVPQWLDSWWCERLQEGVDLKYHWSEYFIPAYIDFILEERYDVTKPVIEKLMEYALCPAVAYVIVGPYCRIPENKEIRQLCTRRIIYDLIVHGDYRMAPKYPDYWRSGDFKLSPMYGDYIGGDI